MEQHYCRRCGAALIEQTESAARCPNGHTIYANPAPCVGIFLFDAHNQLLLGVRKIEPKKGMLDAIGGFVAIGETSELALTREIQEEICLTPHDYTRPSYLTSASSTYEYGGETRIVLSNLYYATLRDGAVPQPADDVAAIKLFNLDDVSVDDIGNDDIKQGFLSLRELFAHRATS